MKEDGIELTRRKILASAGAIGLAGSGAGLGTSAYFSDEESFDDNTLTAGELDLKVDWEEHYWNDFDVGDIDVSHPSSPDDVGDGQVALPSPDDPLIAVAEDDLDAFMDATAIEAYPDSDDDGIQDDLEGYDACEDFADTPDDLNPRGSYRSSNSDTWIDMGEGDYAPLVNLHDVKPGDLGELTLSFHLCDNPGYVWLQGEPVSAAENGHTEPEADATVTGAADEEVSGQDVLTSDVELLDEIQTMLWYDEDGDNVFEPGGESGGKADVVLVLDRSGSMRGERITEAKSAAKNLVDALNLGSDAGQVGIVSFSDQERLDQGLTTDATAAKNAIDGLSAGGSTNIEGGVNGGEEELTGADHSADVSASGNHRSDAEKVMVVMSDGAPNRDDDGDGSDDPVDEADRAKSNGVEMYTIGFGISSGSSTAATLEDMASDPSDSHFYLGGAGDLTQIFGQIGKQIAGEEVFFTGTMRDLLTEVSSGDGIALDGDRASEFDELNDPDDADARDQYTDSTNNFVGFAWWLPRSVGNEIQSDSVSFDLGFYTEQARHNDGAGPTAAD